MAPWPYALAVAVIIALSVPPAFAHLEHLPHYNGMQRGVEDYVIHQALEPEYAGPGQLTAIMFSVQDYDGNDVRDVETMVEIYSSTGERVKAFPWTKHDIGDFTLYYTFPKAGNYQLIFSIANGPVNSNTVDPPRGTLLSTAGCNCERVVSNLNISATFGDIFTYTVLGAIFAPLVGIGSVLWISFRKKRSAGQLSDRSEIIKYAVMLSALGGGMVHFAVFSEHGSLRLEYPIFLITAGGMQVSYGIMYIMLTLTSGAGADPARYYRKTVGLNLFGMAGTAILVGLYTYSVIFPPPLSPTDQPEQLEVAGVVAKYVEVFLIGGITYLMRYEKKKLREQIPSKT
ncbi:hypothetical protein [Nitrososphaera sp.]|uniref:hypothetical protein n=1 Tax=Nitrososphaera sp. TaxID=1971748 RepID=UPI001819D2A4|nr:hypothetical protein [Nitrososphaera sp.]NWG37877.1 hypothetical protein [Nitrososphaera sp.]